MMSPEAADQPRSMRDAEVRTQRSSMLGYPHIIDLTKFAEELRERRPEWAVPDSDWEVPDFDPCDGGVEARALFLFEKPGPMTAAKGSGKRSGLGFISRNNDDRTAVAIFDFMHQAGIPRKQTILWNVVPGWNGTRAVTRAELEDGVRRVKHLIDLLPKLRAIMLVGNKATKAKPELETTEFCLFNSFHPSPLVKARWPEKWNGILLEWQKLANCIA
jgi:hypothetical protein